MTKKRHLFVRNAVAILAATPLLWIAPGLNARSSSPSSQESRTSPNSDITRQELARFDQFLDGHQEIAQQLRHDPSLVNDQNYVQGHPELQTFLQDHPGVREEIKENPNYFMRQENRYDRREEAREDNRREELARFDQFLDKHQEIAEQLRRDPSLAKNQQFVNNHPALQAYLQDHQGVREQLDQNPNAFMQQEKTYESRENGTDRGGMNREQHSFGQFLGTHSDISGQLSKNPSLLKNREYMSSHPELQAYMKTHPDAQSQMAKDPDSFLKASQQFTSTKTGTSTGTTTGTTGSVKTTTTPDATKPAEAPKPPKQ